MNTILRNSRATTSALKGPLKRGLICERTRFERARLQPTRYTHCAFYSDFLSNTSADHPTIHRSAASRKGGVSLQLNRLTHYLKLKTFGQWVVEFEVNH